MIKNWNEMAKVDVSAYKKERSDEKGNSFDYLPWVACLRLLHENGAESVRYGVIPADNGHSVHMTEGFADKNGLVTHNPEVWVWVEVDGDRAEIAYPVISGSYVVRDATLNQQRIHTAIQRAFSKAVAVNWGLGISLWEDGDEIEVKPEQDVTSLQSARLLFDKLGGQIGDLMRDFGLSEAEIAEQMGLDTDRIGDVIKVEINRIRDYERSLDRILAEQNAKAK